jgi:N-sulfoglucosamine sulfohydrolase
MNNMKYSFKRAAFLTIASTAIIGCKQNKAKEEEQTEQNQPNILCITCEDISSYLGCYGDPVAHTPNLDKLAEEGVKFTNCFATMGVCAPARASLITGMYPSSFGANNMRTNRKTLPNDIPPYEAVPPSDVKCFTEYLRKAGYYCCNNVKEDYQFNAPESAWDESSNKATWRNRPAGMPFFSIFNIMETHESRIWVNENDPLIYDYEEVPLPVYYPDDPRVRKEMARMYNNVTLMDREFGDILGMLEEDGLLEETIIIFYSDHGGPLPRAKREIYDSGLKVPYIIRFPGKEHAGMVVDELISFVDIPATILSLAGLEVPEYIHGQAFWGPEKAAPRKYIFAARDRVDGHYDTRRAVRDKQFKYIRNYHPEIGCYQDVKFRKSLGTMQALLELKDKNELNQDQLYWFRNKKAEEELYNIIKDPNELNNLADEPQYKADLERMRKVHEQWMEDIDDKGLMTEKELVWSMWPGGVQPVTEPPVISFSDNEVKISCPTEGASISYQVNGKGYNENHWFIYDNGFEANTGDKITAIAHRIGYKPSEAGYVIE